MIENNIDRMCVTNDEKSRSKETQIKNETNKGGV